MVKYRLREDRFHTCLESSGELAAGAKSGPSAVQKGVNIFSELRVAGSESQ